MNGSLRAQRCLRYNVVRLLRPNVVVSCEVTVVVFATQKFYSIFDLLAMNFLAALVIFQCHALSVLYRCI